MSSSLPDGYTVRAATDADAEAVTALVRAAEEAVRGRSGVNADDLRSWWTLVQLPTDSWLVERDGALRASGMLVAHGDVPDFWGVVRPDEVGRGLGSALIELGEARARARDAGALRIGTFAENVPAVKLFTSRGYRDVRHYYTMHIELKEAPVPAWPDGLRVERFRTEDARAFYDALTDAFVDEWGWVAMEYDEWYRLRIEGDDADPSLWFVVREGDEIAAVVRNDPNRYGGGWVGAIGVRAPWRRRGIGLALLQHTFAEFHERGTNDVRLGVDTQNPSGATRLYERAGMSVELEEVIYERGLA
jgi:ribosomal protein S18 acetylase RimI-like enzyme